MRSEYIDSQLRNEDEFLFVCKQLYMGSVEEWMKCRKGGVNIVFDNHDGGLGKV